MLRQGIPEPATDALSPGELRAALDSLPDAEFIRLERIARRLCGFSSMDAGDFLHEAVVRALDGTRRCPREVNVSAFLIGIMKSLATAERKSFAVARADELGDDPPAAPDTGPQAAPPPMPDEVVDQQHRRKQIDALFALFEGDDDAQLALMAWMDTDTLAEAQAVTGFDATKMNTLRRRIRRTVERKYPKGLRP